MPGPVSDSFDPEFGTGSNAADVAEAIIEVRDKITAFIGSSELKDIVQLAQGKTEGLFPMKSFMLDEREARIIRFAMNYALDLI